MPFAELFDANGHLGVRIEPTSSDSAAGLGALRGTGMRVDASSNFMGMTYAKRAGIWILPIARGFSGQNRNWFTLDAGAFTAWRKVTQTEIDTRLGAHRDRGAQCHQKPEQGQPIGLHARTRSRLPRRRPLLQKDGGSDTGWSPREQQTCRVTVTVSRF